MWLTVGTISHPTANSVHMTLRPSVLSTFHTTVVTGCQNQIMAASATDEINT